MTNVTSDLVTSVSPIPTSGEEEVTSSSTTLNPADSPANDEPSNDGEAQPDPKPENEETVADEKGKIFPIFLPAFLIAQFSGILSNRNSETLHFGAKSLSCKQEDQIFIRVLYLALVQLSFRAQLLHLLLFQTKKLSLPLLRGRTTSATLTAGVSSEGSC